MTNQLDRDLSIAVFNDGQQLCQESYIDCNTYHYMRPILRRIDAVPSSYSHFDFYNNAIQNALAKHNEAKIIISGTADYSWLLEDSPLLKGLGAIGTVANIQVLDGCSTPTKYSMLASNKLEKHTFEMNTQNITKFFSNEKVSDLIITDALLTQFKNKQDRLAILNQWKQSLRFGGNVITTAQIAQENQAGKHNAENNFIKNTAALYMQSEYPDILQLNKHEFTDRIRSYSSPNASRIYTSEQELTEEIAQTGLKIVDMNPATIYSKSSEKILSYREIVLTI